MNKNDLIQTITDRTGLAKHDATKAVDGVFDAITDALKAGDEVRLTGFGVFAVANRAAGIFVTSLYGAAAGAGYLMGLIATHGGWHRAGEVQLLILSLVGGAMALALRPDQMAL